MKKLLKNKIFYSFSFLFIFIGVFLYNSPKVEAKTTYSSTYYIPDNTLTKLETEVHCDYCGSWHKCSNSRDFENGYITISNNGIINANLYDNVQHTYCQTYYSENGDEWDDHYVETHYSENIEKITIKQGETEIYSTSGYRLGENLYMTGLNIVCGIDYTIILDCYSFCSTTECVLNTDGESSSYYSEAIEDDTTYSYETITFTMKISDTSAPTITGVSEESTYSSNQTISIYDEESEIVESYYTINDSKINFSNSFTTNQDGTYYVYAKNTSGFSNSRSFYINTTKPELTVYSDNSKITKNETIKKAITAKATDTFGISSIVVYNSSNTEVHSFNNDSFTPSTDGFYKIIATDSKGQHSDEFTFYWDTTPPEIPNELSFSDLNGDKIPDFSENSITINIPDDCYKWVFNGTTHTYETGVQTIYYPNKVGNYTIYLYDDLNNENSYTWYWDNEDPTLSIFSGGIEFKNDGSHVNKEITINVFDSSTSNLTVIIKDSNGNTVKSFNSNSFDNSVLFNYNDFTYSTKNEAINQLIADVKASSIQKEYNNNTSEIWSDSSNNGFINGLSYYYYNNLFFINENTLIKYAKSVLVNTRITSSVDSYTPTQDGTYYVYATDFLNNQTSREFVWDETAPVCPTIQNPYTSETLLINIPNGCSYWELWNNQKIDKYTSSKTLEYSFLGESYYYLYFYDEAGNVSSTSFLWDRTVPTVKYNGNTVEAGSTINTNEESLAFIVNDKFLEIDGSLPSKTMIESYTSDGKFTIEYTDGSNNIITFYIYWDRTAPTATTLSWGANGATTNADSINITFDSNDVKEAFFNGISYTSGTEINSNSYEILDGKSKFTFVLTDYFGNTSEEYYFYWDRTPSKTSITLKNDSLGQQFANGIITNSENISITLSSDCKYYILKNTNGAILDEVYNDGSTKIEYNFYDSIIKGSSQTYYFYTYDEIGNELCSYWYWDCLAPDGELKNSEGNKVINNTNSNELSFSWSDSNIKGCILYLPHKIYYDLKNSSVLYADEPTLKNIILEELKVNITLITYLNSMSGLIYDGDTGTFTDGLECYKYDGYIFSTQASAENYIKNVKANERIVSYQSISITNGQTLNFADYLMVSGDYKIILTDTANNPSPYTWYWDCNAPVINVNTIGGNTVEYNSTTFSNVKISISDDSGISSKEIYLNDTLIAWNTDLTDEGSYFIEVVDSYNNISTYSFNVIKSIDFTIHNSTSEIEQKSAYNEDINIKWDTELYKATLYKNGVEINYSSGDSIFEEAKYRFKISYEANGDKLENEFEFYIDKTADTNNYDALVKNGYNWASMWYNTYDINGKIYSFKTYSEAYFFAEARERLLVRGDNSPEEDILEFIDTNNDGYLDNTSYIWQGFTVNTFYSDEQYKRTNAKNNNKIYIYKNEAGSYVIFYDSADLNTCLELHITNSISTHYNIDKNNYGIVDATREEYEYFYKDAFYINVSEINLNKADAGTSVYYSTDNITFNLLFTKNMDESTSSSTKLNMNNVSRYYIKEIDKAGNELTYTIIFESQKTNITVNNGSSASSDDINNNLLVADTVYTKTGFTFTPSTPYDSKYYIVKITYWNLAGESITSYIVGDSFSISTTDGYDSFGFIDNNTSKKYVGFGAGKYSFVVYSASGVQSDTYTVYYQPTEPKITWQILQAEDGTQTGLSLNILYNQIYGISNPLTNIYLYLDDELISEDDSTTPVAINIKNLSYLFKKNGKYSLKIYDCFSNTIISEESLELNAPTGQLFVNNVLVSSSNNYGIRAYMTWNKDYGYTATLYTIIAENNGELITTEEPYTRESAITAEGSYYISLSNGDKETKYYFIIDTTVPTAQIIADNAKVSNGGTTGSHYCYLEFDETEYKCYLDEEKTTEYKMLINGEYNYITTDGTTVWYLYDKAGNSKKYTVNIDWTPIDVIIKTSSGSIIENGASINKKLYFTWSGQESNATVYFTSSDGLTTQTYPNYVAGTTFQYEGLYRIDIVDRYNNYSYFYASIDYTIPDAYVSYGDEEFGYVDLTVSGTYYINKPFSVNWNDEEYDLIINNKYVQKGTILSSVDKTTGIGEYDIKVISKSQNTLTFKIYLSYLIPEATFEGLDSDFITNKNVYAYFSGNGTKATLNDEEYYSGQKISAENYYTLVLENKYGSTNSYSFTIDKTPEILYLENVYSGGYTNTFAYAYWNDPTTVSGTITKYYGEGIYYDTNYPSVKDTYSVLESKIINEIIPLAEMVKYSSDYASKKWNDSTNIGFVNDLECYYYDNLVFATKSIFTKYIKNNIASLRIKDANEPMTYISGSNISEEGEWIITITDLGGNSTTVSFTIDKTPCEFYNNREIESGATINQSIYFYWKETSAVGYLNGVEWANGKSIKDDGTYIFKLVDIANNESEEFVFTIKTSLPEGTLLNVENAGFTNKPVYFSWIEPNCKAYISNGILPEAEYVSGTPIKEANCWSIRLVDLAGNENNYSFEISYDIPVAELLNVVNGGYTSKNVYINFPSDCTATLNGKSYTANKRISEELNYTFVLTNKFGTSNTYTFIIERIEPVAELSCDKYTNKPVYLVWSDSSYTVSVSYNNVVNETYVSGTPLSEEATYIFTVITRAGVSKTYTAELSYQEPVGIFKNLGDNNFSNQPVYFIFTETGSTATLDGKEYFSNTKIATEGKHQIILTSKFGNTKIFDFELDLTPPEGKLYGIKNTNGNFTNQEVYLEWFEEGATAKISYGSIVRDYVSKEPISEANTYLIILQDSAGNEKHYTFEISYQDVNLNMSNVNEYGYSNKNITLQTVDSSDSIYVNDVQVSNGYIIKNDGTFKVSVKNKYGTIKEYTITRDTVACEIEIYNIFTSNKNGNFTSKPVRLYWSENTATAILYKNGVEVGIFDYTNTVDDDGEYELKLYDIANNESNIKFKICRDKPFGSFTNVNEYGYTNKSTTFVWECEATATLNEQPYENGSKINTEGNHIICLTSIYGVSDYFYITQDFTNPTATLKGVKDKGFTNKSVKINFDEGFATLNGAEYISGTTIKDANYYEFVLSDYAGNICSYSFTISFDIPSGILFGVENDGITNQKVSLSWTDNTYYAKLNGADYSNGRTIYQDGEYELKLYNKFGSFEIYSFIIDTQKASLEIMLADGKKADIKKALSDDLYINQDFTLIPSEENTIIKFNDILYTEGLLLTDEMKYNISISDRAGNIEYYYVNVLKSNPTFELVNVEPNGYTNTFVKISFDANQYTCYVNGKEYESGKKISEDNIYYVSVKDKAGNEATTQFEISTKESTGTLVGVQDEGYTNLSNGNVKFIYSEEGCYATYTRTYKEIVGEEIKTITTPITAYPSELELKEEGEYFITLTNKFGVKSVVSFIVDLTPASLEDVIIKNVVANGYTNKSVSISWDNPLLYVKINNDDYSSGKSISNNGVYVASVYDLAGNVIEFTFEINNEFAKDSVSIFAQNVVDENNEIPQDKEVSFSWENETYEATLLKNGEALSYSSGQLISEVGKYEFKLKDKYGNEYIQEFEILDTTVDHTSQNIITIVIVSVIGVVIVVGIIIRLSTKRRGIYSIK